MRLFVREGFTDVTPVDRTAKIHVPEIGGSATGDIVGPSDDGYDISISLRSDEPRPARDSFSEGGSGMRLNSLQNHEERGTS